MRGFRYYFLLLIFYLNIRIIFIVADTFKSNMWLSVLLGFLGYVLIWVLYDSWYEAKFER